MVQRNYEMPNLNQLVPYASCIRLLYRTHIEKISDVVKIDKEKMQE